LNLTYVRPKNYSQMLFSLQASLYLMSHVFRALFFASILISSGAVLPFAFAQNSTTTLSPLKQFKSGVPTYYTACKENLLLAVKNATGKSACIKSSSISRFTERGYAVVGYPVDIVGTLDYEKRRPGGPFAYCYLFSITANETMKTKFLLYTNVIVYPNDWIEIMYPGNKLTPELKEKYLHIVGTQVENHGPWGCGKYVHNEKTGIWNLLPDTDPVINPSKIEILAR